jgi:hypothetical protein
MKEMTMEDSTALAARFRLDMELKGWCLFDRVLDEATVARLRADCLSWIDVCNQLQVAAGINEKGDGTGHHTLGRGDSLDEFIAGNPLHPWIESYFGGRPYILHAFNPVGGAPLASSYVHRIHRDAGTHIQGLRLKINMLVMLDDFSVANGATQFLNGSHHLEEKPPDMYFSANSASVLGAKGSIVLFNSYLWHRAGVNSTSAGRVALTLAYSPPYLKPQLDYARMLGPEYACNLSDVTRQILGYNALTPQTLEEWYRPRETRLYRSNQG